MPTDYNQFVADVSAYLVAAKAGLNALDGIPEQNRREILALISDVESKITILRLATSLAKIIPLYI